MSKFLSAMRPVVFGTALVLTLTTSVSAADKQAGLDVYSQAACAACHGADAKGTPGVFPRLAGRVGEIAELPDGKKYLVSAVSYGMVGPIKADGRTMSGFMQGHPHLSDASIATILNWLTDPGGASGGEPFTASFVADVRKTPMGPSDVHRMRQDVITSDFVEKTQ